MLSSFKDLIFLSLEGTNFVYFLCFPLYIDHKMTTFCVQKKKTL